MKNTTLIGLLCLFIFTLQAQQGSIDKIGISSAVSSDNKLKCIIGSPYGKHLSDSGGSLTVSAQYSSKNAVVVSSASELLNSKMQVKVYPNPSSTELVVDMLNDDTIINITLTDMQGRVVITKLNSPSNSRIDISALSSGNYILNIQDIKGNNIQNFNIIKN